MWKKQLELEPKNRAKAQFNHKELIVFFYFFYKKGEAMKTMLFKYKLLLFVYLIAPNINSIMRAQNSKTDSSKIIISGSADLYYSKNFAIPANRINKFRTFDISENQFNLNLAEAVIQKQASPIGFRLDLDFGPTTNLVHTIDGIVDQSWKYLQQAIITVVLPIGKGLTVSAGKFVTHMGAEVIESQSNINYSRSLLFTHAIPYFHVGVCASYPLLNNLSFTGYLFNGWNRIEDNNRGKTLGATLSWSPMDNLTVIQNWIGGVEGTNTNNQRHVLDTILNYTVSDNLSVSLNADYGFERLVTDELAIWKGIALYGKYNFDKTSALALRGEVYSDPSGLTTGVVQDLREITFTYEYKFLSNLLVRLEYRRDWSTASTFDNKYGVNTKKDQNTFLVSSVVSF